MQSEVKRVHFEARMQTQWDVFVKKCQGGGIGGQFEPQIEEEDDFEDLDDQFPKKLKVEVEELEMHIRQDFVFKRRLVNMIYFVEEATCNSNNEKLKKVK